MKKITNILRSIITSLLFLTLIVFTIIQFTFTTIRLSNKNIPELIDREILLKLIIPASDNLDGTTKEVAIHYIDDYINYVFHKRSFPSIQNVDSTLIDETKNKEVEKLLTQIRDKIDMSYENVIALRYVNNFLSNGSIYLLINIGLFIIILLLFIVTGKLLNTASLTGIAIIIASLLILILSSVLTAALPKLLDPLVYNFVAHIFDKQMINKIFNQSLIYTSIGFLAFASAFITKKTLLKKQSQN